MIKEVGRSSSLVGKVVLIVVAVLASNMHGGGAPERAVAVGGASLVVGVVLGLGMVAIVLARLFGRNIGLIRSDFGALVALLVMVTVKIVIARTLLPL